LFAFLRKEGTRGKHTQKSVKPFIAVSTEKARQAVSGLAASMQAHEQKEVECGGRQQSLVPWMARMILDHPYFIPF
jgi:hypothetical protein